MNPLINKSENTKKEGCLRDPQLYIISRNLRSQPEMCVKSITNFILFSETEWVYIYL